MTLPIRLVTAVEQVSTMSPSSTHGESFSHFNNHEESDMPKAKPTTAKPLTPAEKAQAKLDAEAKAKAAATSRASAKHSRQPAKKKPTLIQLAIEKNKAIILGFFSLLQNEPGRIIASDAQGRASVEALIKGCAHWYGPQIKQDDPERIRMFDFARSFYHRKADPLEGFDVADFFSQGETYNGETHLHSNVPFPTLLVLARRSFNGNRPAGVEATDGEILVATKIFARMLRHVETFSCWRNEGMNDNGEAFLFSWPKEVALVNADFYELGSTERAYDPDHAQAMGTGWKKRPAEAGTAPTADEAFMLNPATGRHERTIVEEYDATNEQDASNELSRRHNKNQRLLKSLRD